MVKFTGQNSKPNKHQIKVTQKSDLPDGLQNAAPVNYPIAQTSITALQIYHNPKRKPDQDGPWNNEGDKIAWVDEDSGLGCIILRQEDGTLSGYVGVGVDHPLHGFHAEAVPVTISSQVHGGITYGKECEVNRHELRAKGKPRRERYTVCHITRTRWVQDVESVQTTNDEFEHEDLWWLGFDTNHPGDLIPNDRFHTARKSDVYRDQDFVYAQCVALAKRLKEIAARNTASRAAVDTQARLLPKGEEE